MQEAESVKSERERESREPAGGRKKQFDRPGERESNPVNQCLRSRPRSDCGPEAASLETRPPVFGRATTCGVWRKVERPDVHVEREDRPRSEEQPGRGRGDGVERAEAASSRRGEREERLPGRRATHVASSICGLKKTRKNERRSAQIARGTYLVATTAPPCKRVYVQVPSLRRNKRLLPAPLLTTTQPRRRRLPHYTGSSTPTSPPVPIPAPVPAHAGAAPSATRRTRRCAPPPPPPGATAVRSAARRAKATARGARPARRGSAAGRGGGGSRPGCPWRRGPPRGGAGPGGDGAVRVRKGLSERRRLHERGKGRPGGGEGSARLTCFGGLARRRWAASPGV